MQGKLVEVGAIWVIEFGGKKPILGIKINRTAYIAFKNAKKTFPYDPDFYVYKHEEKTDQIHRWASSHGQAMVPKSFFENHQGLVFPQTPETTDFLWADISVLPRKVPKLKAVGVIWKLFNLSDVQLSLKIENNYYYALPRDKKDPSQKGGFVILEYRTKSPAENSTTELKPHKNDITKTVSATGAIINSEVAVDGGGVCGDTSLHDGLLPPSTAD
jgi:hypothetical protein